jgi:hypothetical protein
MIPPSPPGEEAMSRILREAFLSGVVWAAELASAAEVTPLNVRIYNYAEVTEPTLAAAQTQTVRIFHEAGIEVSWLPCATSDEEFAKSPHKFTACAQATDALTVRIQPNSLGSQAMRAHSWLAMSNGQGAEVFYDRVQQFATDQNCKSASILAIVISHELGHLLLGEESHSSRGIMVPKLRTQEIRRAQKGQLLFTREQVQQMRDRQAQGHLAPLGHDPTCQSRNNAAAGLMFAAWL